MKCCDMEMESGVKWNVLKFFPKNLQFLPNGEKTEMQTSKTQKHKEKCVFGKWLKHAKMQNTSTLKFEIGT